jgi:polysaccharide export outer membrane protein
MRPLLTLTLLLAAAPVLSAEPREAERGPAPEGPAAGYRVGPGDKVRVRVYGEDRITGEYLIGAGGGLDLPWIGRVDVGGATTDEIAQALQARFADGYLVAPDVVVEVTTFASRPVKVLGSVSRAGTYFLKGPTDVIGIIAEAGGVREEGGLGTYEVQISRPRLGSVEPITVSLDRLMHLGESNLALEAGDVIHVTRGKVVFVSGQVLKPGPVPWKEGLTVTQALAAAGGASRTANLRKVVLLRGEQRITISIHDIVKGRQTDVEIRSEDQLLIGESPL